MKHAGIYIAASALLVVALFAVEPARANTSSLSSYDMRRLTGGPDLSFGSAGPNVSLLQRLLVLEDERIPGIYPEKIVSGYFGPLTKRAVARLQARNGIVPQSGYFGPLTKRAVASVPGAGGGIATKSPVTKSPAAGERLPAIPDTDIKTSADLPSDPASYGPRFLSVAPELHMNAEAGLAMEKYYGRVPAVPELLSRLKEAIASEDTKGISVATQGLRAWQGYLSSAYDKLKEVAVAPAHVDNHRALLAWFKYHGELLPSLLDAGTPEPAEIETVLVNYKRVYDANKDDMNKNLRLASESRAIKSRTWGLSRERSIIRALVPVAFAVTGVPFGGLIEIVDVCTITGYALSITPPGLGGAFFLYWEVYAVNPYPYGLVVDGNWILGMATPGPGLCTHSAYDYYTYGEGFIQYFGTALQ